MFAIIWILEYWLPDTCFLETNSELTSRNPTHMLQYGPSPLSAVCISPGQRGSSYVIWLVPGCVYTHTHTWTHNYNTLVLAAPLACTSRHVAALYLRDYVRDKVT